MLNIKELIKGLKQSNTKILARCISIVENDLKESTALLEALPVNNKIPIIGITGPPGAGKSTLVNGLVSLLLKENKKIGILAIDPTSPFNLGALLGDRIRMSNHFNNKNVFIRSLATRGALGGLSAKIIEIIDAMRSYTFDYIIVETVGVGQSEIEIVGIADTTVLVLVPESGDEIQTLKSGIMEIGDIFVVNKSDREGADAYVKNLHYLLKNKKDSEWETPIIKVVATEGKGIKELLSKIKQHHEIKNQLHNKSIFLYAEKAYRLIQNKRMKDIDRNELYKSLEKAISKKDFNIYKFIKYWN